MSAVLFSQHEPVILDLGTLCKSVSSCDTAAVIDWRVFWSGEALWRGGNSRKVTSSAFIASYLYSHSDISSSGLNHSVWKHLDGNVSLHINNMLCGSTCTSSPSHTFCTIQPWFASAVPVFAGQPGGIWTLFPPGRRKTHQSFTAASQLTIQ